MNEHLERLLRHAESDLELAMGQVRIASRQATNSLSAKLTDLHESIAQAQSRLRDLRRGETVEGPQQETKA